MTTIGKNNVDFVCQPDFGDYVPQLPSFVRDNLLLVRDAISDLRRKVVSKYGKLSGIAERRDFAIIVHRVNLQKW